MNTPTTPDYQKIVACLKNSLECALPDEGDVDRDDVQACITYIDKECGLIEVCEACGHRGDELDKHAKGCPMPAADRDFENQVEQAEKDLRVEEVCNSQKPEAGAHLTREEVLELYGVGGGTPDAARHEPRRIA